MGDAEIFLKLKNTPPSQIEEELPYKVAKGRDPDSLEEEVKRLLTDGYGLQGGLSATFSPEYGNGFYQAMTKVNNTK